MEAGTITCPNCGASTSNHQNCEYCGSLFVRYHDLGLQYDNHKYEEQIIGLKEALKDNLSAQKRNVQNHIDTFIRCEDPRFTIEVMNPKAMHDMIYYTLECNSGTVELHTQPSMQFQTSEPSLLVCFRFVELPTSWTRFDSAAKDENDTQKAIHNRFKNMEEYPLFKHVEEDLYTSANLKNSKFHSYYIDFGQDFEGAAAIISQYIKIVYGIYNLASLDVNYDLTVQTEEEYQTSVANQESSGKGMLWLAVLFFVACGIGGYFMGGVIGILIIIGSVFMVIAGIVKAVQS